MRVLRDKGVSVVMLALVGGSLVVMMAVRA
jgi:hypothetical protein